MDLLWNLLLVQLPAPLLGWNINSISCKIQQYWHGQKLPLLCLNLGSAIILDEVIDFLCRISSSILTTQLHTNIIAKYLKMDVKFIKKHQKVDNVKDLWWYFIIDHVFQKSPKKRNLNYNLSADLGLIIINIKNHT